MLIEIYDPTARKTWDQFITNSSNGHFIFYRNFMEYHSDRFTDNSLLIYEKDKLIALLPANIKGDVIFSHSGLTFGGLITNSKIRSIKLIEILKLIKSFFCDRGIKEFLFKAAPAYIYQSICNDMEYALFNIGAQLVGRDLGAVINLQEKITYSKNRKRVISKAGNTDIQVVTNGKISELYPILVDTLKRHKSAPTHSFKELEYLQEHFPENIRCSVVKNNFGQVIAGCIFFNWKHFIHTQYLASSIEGREVGALDYLLDHEIKRVPSNIKYFSFGISTLNQGKLLNDNLLRQKQGFGANSQIQDCYQIKIQ